jgi:crotonobetainyl-CoA:carnitine CoA-transferase CaiB-like acyl-CoA transferase
MTLPLQGIRILDSAHQYPGPYCSMLLSDLGAEVIKIERPGTGDFARQLKGFFQAVNRGKKSITLDLKKSEAREIFYRLTKTADILTEGFRPGVTSRLGIDYKTLERINPRLVYCSISGFGQEGPYRDLPGHDLNYTALSGILQAFQDDNGNYLDPKLAIGDLSSGMFATVGILAALQAREKTKRGQYVDVSIFDGLVSLMSTTMGNYYENGQPFRSFEAAYGIFKGVDGLSFTLGIAYEDWFWSRLCTAIGLDEYKDMPNVERVACRTELKEKLQEVFISKTRDEWVSLLKEADVPVAPIQNAQEVGDDPHVSARNLIQEVTLKSGEINKQIAFPVKLSETPAKIQGPPPELGQDTEILLKDMGYNDEMITDFKKNGAI